MADGGVIPGRAIMYLYNRSTQQTEKLKDIPYDCPDVFLTGKYGSGWSVRAKRRISFI